MALAKPTDVLLALSLLSRLPLPKLQDWSRQADAAWAYPLVGLVIGGLAALFGWLAHLAGLPTPVIAMVTLLASILLTGAMHEDGFADCADGFWGGWDKAKRLEIMKDSQIGSYGVIALVISLITRWVLLWWVWENGALAAITAIIAAAMVSRAAMPVLMYALPHARDKGLSHSVGAVPKASAATGIVVAALGSLLLLGVSAFGVLLAAAAITWGVAMLSLRKIGGQTGDVLGATQQMTEIAALTLIVTQ